MWFNGNQDSTQGHDTSSHLRSTSQYLLRKASTGAGCKQLLSTANHVDVLMHTFREGPIVRLGCSALLPQQEVKGQVAISYSAAVLGLCQVAGCPIGGCSKPVTIPYTWQLQHHRERFRGTLHVLHISSHQFLWAMMAVFAARYTDL